jgi:tetratricopeptide (TPR) repeat protein
MLSMRKHITECQAEHLVEGALSRQEGQEVVRHLLTSCPHCMKLLRRLEGGMAAVAELAAYDYSDTFAQVQARGLAAHAGVAAERARGEAQWASRLEPQPHSRRLLLLENDTSLQHWGVYEAILSRCRQVTRESPSAGMAMAQLAVAASDRLSFADYGEERVHDFRMAARVALGNASRAAGDFRTAASAFETARALLASGTGDPLEEASLASGHAALLGAQGEFEKAVASLHAAIRLYREAGDRRAVGYTLLQQASIICHVEPERGLLLATRGLALIDPKQDSYADLSGRHTIANCLLELGRLDEARALLAESRSAYDRFPDLATRTRYHWLEGAISREMGALEEAEQTFLQLRDLYLENGFDFEAVLISLDLSEVLLRLERFEDAETLIQEAYPILEAWGLRRDTLALWMTLIASIRERVLDEKLFRLVADHLRHNWLSKEN